MAIGNGEVMHKHSRICCSQTLAHGNSKNEIRYGNSKIKFDKERDKKCKKRGVSIKRSTAGTKKRSPDDLSHTNQNKQNIVVFYKIWKKYKEI